ncbi:MAG: 16S rRNA (guanine(966)-N(2))-methyltransferase RsmD [Candidatus Dojkabacteria bacterium]
MSLRQDSFKKLRKDKNKWKISSAEDFEAMEQHFLEEKYKHEEPTVKGEIRITAGKAKNVQIEIPRGTRPVTERMKMRIFDVIREDIVNRRVLDLYAGSGSFGLEAISRGAASAILVDASKHAQDTLHDNVRKTAFLTETEIIRSKVEDYLPLAITGDERFEIIFIDPPYKLYNKKDLTKMTSILQMAAQLLPGYHDWDTKLFKGIIVLKHPRRYPIGSLEIDKLTKYETFDFGANSLSVFIVKQDGDSKSN